MRRRGGVPLLPLIDQWAALPCRVSRSYDGADAATAWERRRNDLQHLAGITDVLTDVERRADELNRRAAELVEDWL